MAVARPLIIIGVLFFIFGFVTWLSAVLIPYLQLACELNSFQSYLVAFAFYISYFVTGIPAGWLLRKTGFKKGLTIGLLLVAVGSLLFIPAAMERLYPVFLVGLFVQGAGLTVLQTASNPYVAILGPQESAARRISFMGICNGIAGILAPLILGAVILNDADALKDTLSLLSPAEKITELNTLAAKVILPYSIITAVLVLLSVLIYYSGLPEVEEELSDAETNNELAGKSSVLQFPHLLLGVLALFVYTGVEVIAANSIIGYGAYYGIPLSTSRLFSSFTLVGMLVGYLIGIICMPRYFSQESALKGSAVFGLLCAAAALLTNGLTSIVFVALLGLANSLMWPAIWALAIVDLGKFTKAGSALLVMAISGAAVLPLLYGYITDLYNPKLAYVIAVPCYLIIGYYAVYGHKMRRRILNQTT